MKHLYQNREVSALSFNERVLQEAEDTRNPLMERLRFLGIFSSNMDEFYKVRVAGVQRRLELGKDKLSPVIEFIGEKTRELDERFRAAYDEIIEQFARENVRVLTERDIDQQPNGLAEWAKNYFRNNVLPTLVPIIIDERRKFPRLTDGALYFAVRMWNGERPYAILEIPPELPRFVELPNNHIMYVDDLIRYSLHDVFYIFKYDRIEAFEFKISRDAELDIDNDFSEGHVRKMQRVLEQRKGGRPTRFVHDSAMPPGLKRLLLKELEITTGDTVIPGGRYHNMKDLRDFPSRRPDLNYPPMEPVKHPVFDKALTPVFDEVLREDQLLTYPYQSFDHVVRLLREAAIDPRVQEIKLTLYRAAKQSQTVNALVNAARNGKHVLVSVELLARFDEMHNIQLAERLTEAGATVVFGVPPMKVHCKLLLIRRDGDRIAGVSTGNFNEATGKLYVDSTLFTANKALVHDVDEVFDYLERSATTRTLVQPKFKRMVVSPFNSRDQLHDLIARETAKGADGYICLKVNHLTDTKVVKRITQAADAGVKMDLIVRTTYCVPPHPNIRAISILDRFLEHQRAYVFGRGNDRAVFLASCDLMERNLDWRVEAACPVEDPAIQQRVVDLLNLQINDTYKARLLDDAQSNPYVGNGRDGLHAQTETYRYFQRLYEESIGPMPVLEAAFA